MKQKSSQGTLVAIKRDDNRVDTNPLVSQASEYSRSQKEHSKETHIHHVVIIQNIMKGLVTVLSFHKRLLGFSFYT